MKRFSSIILSILLGAIAVGGGMFIFLKKANDDRTRLSGIVTQSQEQMRIAQETSQKTIEDANKKLAAANEEVTKAQDVIKSLQEERELITKATLLESPRPNVIKGWKQVIDIPLGISAKIPPGNIIELNDEQALAISDATKAAGTAGAGDGRWLSATAYDERLDSELLASLATSTPISYLAGSRLLIGVRGTLPGSADGVLVLQVRKDGRATHLIWARVPPGVTEKTVLTSLATLDFAQ